MTPRHLFLGILFLQVLGLSAAEGQNVGPAIIRHAPSLSGTATVDGSLQQLTGENVTLQDGNVITGDLLVPGSPTQNISSSAVFGGTIVGSGSTSPSNYTVKLNGQAHLGHLRTRTDPVTLATVPTPPTPGGTRVVTISSAGQSAGDFSTLRDLTINGGIGNFAVPPGTYGSFKANDRCGFTFGVAGATQPAVYNLQQLTFNGTSTLNIIGPVILNVANGFTGTGAMGSSNNPSWLTLKISSGGLTLSGSCSLYGFVFAPSGTATFSSTSQLIGGLSANQLSMSGGLLRLQAFVPYNSPPTANNQTIDVNEDSFVNFALTGSDPDGNAVTFIVLTQPGHGTLTGTAPNLSYTPAANYCGPDTFAFKTNDGQLDSSPASISFNVICVDDPPAVSLTAPNNNAQFVEPATITVTANATDIDDAVAKVEFFAGATKIGETTTTPYQIQWNNVVAGNYVLTAKATDASGISTTSAPINIAVDQVPVVNAGADQTIRLPAVANLSGSATDDGRPAGSSLTYTWTKTSGPGTITFDSATSAATAAHFSTAGTYVLRLTVSDSLAAGTDDITVIVLPANQPPVVNAGAAQTIELPNTVVLAGSATDDGVPGVPLTYSWSKVSGPGAVTFQAPTSASSRTGFSQAGTYVLRLTVSDSDLSGSGDVSITVKPKNNPPVVNAGPDQNITLPNAATLAGSANDDGNPVGSSLSIDWTKVSGPGTVTFANRNSAATSATFSAAGTYTVRLSASDTELAATDDVVVVVKPHNNPPTVNGGGNKTTELPGPLLLNGTATDDGVPANTPLVITWTQVSGPGSAIFASPSQASTSVTFSQVGTYVLRLTANDSELSSSDQINVEVRPRSNRPPTVNAGPDQTLNLYNVASLSGQVTDDGLPNGTVTTTWSKVSGPGDITFGNAGATTTTATFSKTGTYVLRLTADDSALSAYDEVTITANFQNQAPVVDAGPDQGSPLFTPVALNGKVTDDGLPSGAPLTITWTKISGPGTVTFADSTADKTTATFSATGTYVLQLTANDSELNGSDQVTVQIAATCTTPPSGLVAFWPADDNARDAVGSANGTLLNGATFGLGEVNDAFLLNGTNAIKVPHQPATDVGTGPGFTVELWVNPTDLQNKPLVEWNNGSTFGVHIWVSSFGQGTLFANVLDTAGNFHFIQSAANVMVANTFQHVALTYDKTTGLAVLYKDGQIVAQQNLGIYTPQTSYDLYFGERPGTFFSGKLDEISLYQRALRQDEIQAIYSAGSGGKCQNALNHPPAVSAGPDTTIPLSYTLSLQGSVTDDGLPAGAPVTSTWTVVSGPGAVSFQNASSLTTSVNFAVAGTYVLRLTASDSDLSATSTVTITVLPDGQTVPPTITITPYQAGDWHYQIYASGTVPANVGAIDFDDSNYLIGQGGFGSGGGCPIQSTVHTNWPVNTEIVLRRVVNLPGNVTNVRVSGTVDNDVQILINGVDASGGFVNHENCAQLDDTRINVVTNSLLPGNNLFVIHARDRGGESYVDAQLLVDQPITADAGPDQTVPGGATVTLDGSHSNAFSGSPLSYQWSQINGPAVSLDLTDPVHPHFIAPSLNANATLIFRLFVNDGRITSNPDTVSITVAPAGPPNQAPVVNAGADQTLQSSVASLAGSVQDDGLPAGSTLRSRWSVVSGPGSVTFADSGAPVTSATFSRPGTYVLRLSANDTQLLSTDDVSITVPAGVNLAPTVNAGADQTINTSQVANLAAQVSDDGLPNGTLTVRWTQVSGPGQATFANPFAATTTASFNATGVYTLRISASDSALTSTDDIVITVVSAVNQPPTANAGPDQTISIHDVAILNGTGDDDGLPQGTLYFQWSVVSGPGSVNFASANNVLSASFGAPGVYVLRFLVSDSQLIATDDVVITVYGDNQAPVVSAGGDQSIRSGNSASLNGSVTDDGLPIGSTVTSTWSKVSGPGNVTFANANAPATSATFDQPGTYVLQLSATDGQLSSTSATSVFVTSAANIPPAVSITSPADGSNALSNHTVFISANASDSDGTVVKVAFFVNGGKIGETAVSPFNFSWSGGAAGTYSLTAVATDNEGATTTSAAVTVQLVDESNAQPVVDLISPAEGDTLTAPTQFIGTVSTPILQSYVLQYRLKDQACAQWVTFATGYNSVTNASLGSLDTTLLRNGVYEIRLIATDLNGAAYALDRNIVVDGNMKVGHFSVAFNDLQIPLAGVPISVTRTYDSRESCSGDFGVGWNLDVDSVRLQKNFALGDAWFADVQPPPDGNPFVIPVYSILDDGPHVITINFPDGKTYRFQPVLRLKSNGQPLVRPYVPFGVDDAISMTFEALPGTQGQLIGRGVPASLYMEDGTYDAPTRFLSTPQDFNTDFADATGFDFVTQDGRTFTFDAQGKLTTMTDRLGNSVTFQHNGILHSSGKSIQFVRDGNDRITQIIDPNGAALNYQYDAAGDLVAFFDRTVDPSVGPATATFTYSGGSHYLTGIFDSRGIQGIKNFYDAGGRLYETDDADGNQTVITHDLDHRKEIIRDRNGNTTTHEYDERGNITLTINAKGEQTALTYHVWSDGTKSDLKETETVTGLFSDGNGGTTTKSLSAHYFYEPDDGSPPLNDGLLRKIVDPLGNATTFTYDGFGRVLTVTDARQNASGSRHPSVTNTYFDNGNLQTTQDALGDPPTSYTYDGNGNRKTESRTVTVNGVAQTLFTTTTYDATGFLQQIIDPAGHVTNYVGDANNNVLKETTTRTNSQGATVSVVTEHEYDDQNRLIRTWNAENPRASASAPTSETVYNSLGKPEYVYDAVRHVTHNEYDDRGYLAKVTYPDGNFELTSYDKDGQRQFFTDRGGRKTQYHYDAVGRLDQTIFLGTGANSPIVLSSSTFDAAGRVLTSTDANNNTTTSIYDDAGRRVGTLNAKNELSRYGYDANGNQTSFTDSLNRTITYGYDAMNRRVSTLFPATEVDVNGTLVTTATETVTGYDELGRRVAEYEQSPVGTSLGQRLSKQFVYDALGRLTDVIDATHLDTHYTYDELGNQLSQRDANQHTTNYGYDNIGRRLTRILPLGQSELNTYDAAGNLRFRKDFNGNTTEYRYDALNRLSSKIPDPSLGNTTVGYTYTPSGKRASMSDVTGGTTYGYTERDQLQTKTTPFGTLSYSYYPTGSLASIQSNNTNGVSVSYDYDPLNRLGHVSDTHVGTTSYAYDPVGNLDHFTYPNGVKHAYGYDALNRLKGLGVYNGGQSLLSGYNYTVAPVGQRTSVQENSGRTVGYSYDNLHRLTGEAIAGAPGINGVISYVYDNVSNRQSRTSSVPGISNQSFGYDENDRLTSDTYDNNGNTKLGRLDGIPQPVSDSYDFENHLVNRNNGAVQITYDGDGNKVREIANGHTTTYLVDDRNPTGYAQVMEQLTDGVVTRLYTFGHDLLSENQLISGNWSPSFYGYDGHGSVRSLTNNFGQVTDSYTYDAFGTSIQSAGSTPNEYRYSGEQLDSNLGLYYLRARYLNAANGRFWTMDSYEGRQTEPQNLHKYTYAACDALNRIDPSGRFSLGEVSIGTEIALSVTEAGLAVLAYEKGFRENGGREAVDNPPHGYELDVNESSVRIRGSIKTANEIFDYVRTVPVSKGISPYGAIPVSKVGDIVSFDFPFGLAELGQADFDVRVNKFDAENRFFSVITQQGHPLQGWRFWKVSELDGDIVVSTGAVDKANGWAGLIKYYLEGKDAILPLWHEMLDNVTSFSGGQRVLGDPLDFPEGRWVPEKKDEFLRLVQ